MKSYQFNIEKGIKFRYILINIVVILATVALFIVNYRNVRIIFQTIEFCQILTIFVVVSVVHSIKACRLYLMIYGSELKFSKYAQVYCKVTPVSAVLPYKLGEFFRMYCYGKILRNILKGIVIVFLDRFMDTSALVTTILAVWIFNGTHITIFIYMLFIFIVVTLFVYLIFPEAHNFWKKYILRIRATRNRLSLLRLLAALNRLYGEIRDVLQGRGFILYFMSLIAWIVEIGSVFLQVGLIGDKDYNAIISNYLLSTMGKMHSTEQQRFAFASVVMMILIYASIKIVGISIRKKVV